MVERNLAKVEVASSRLVSRSRNGAIAKWLCTGLQIRLRRFDSASRLQNAGVAQLVERNLAKVEVASSRLVSRSRISKEREASCLPFFSSQRCVPVKRCQNDGTGRRSGLKIRRCEISVRVRFPFLAPIEKTGCFVETKHPVSFCARTCSLSSRLTPDTAWQASAVSSPV